MKCVTLCLALALDFLFGDPPNRWHPTAWMGRLIGCAQTLRRRLLIPVEPASSRFIPSTASAPPSRSQAVDMAYGAGVVLGGMSLAGAVGAALSRLCACLPAPLGWLVEAALLKTTFSLRGLDRAAAEVQSALESGDLPEARRSLAWHLVSRDTAAMDERLVAAAAIESVAENTSDGVIAPLVCYALGGLPAALAYRFANTADAMLGYHTLELEWFGKVPARLDDLLNLLPARLTGLLIALAAPLAGGSARGALCVMHRDAGLTQSPNAGYPMSAMAGALGVELEKRGHYKLGAAGRTTDAQKLPTRSGSAADIRRARRTMLAAAFLFAGGYLGLSVCSPSRRLPLFPQPRAR